MGNAFDEKSLLEACAGLKSQGYARVHILRSGSAAWAKYDSVPENDKLDRTLYYLTPANLHDPYFKEKYTVLNISGEANSVIEKKIPGVKVVTLSGSASKLFNKIRNFLEKNKTTSKFILVDKEGRKYKSLYKLNAKYPDKFFFFLGKGIKGLNKYEINNMFVIKKELKMGKVRTCSN